MKDIPALKLKNKVKLSEFKATKRIKNKKWVSKALLECLTNKDVEGFKEILSAHLELVNKDEFVKKAGISRKSLIQILSKNGDQTLNHISKIIFQLSS